MPSTPPHGRRGRHGSSNQKTSPTGATAGGPSPPLSPPRPKTPEPNLLSPFGSPMKHKPVPELNESNEMEPAIRFRNMGGLILTTPKYSEPMELKKRPGFVTAGTEFSMDINSYSVLAYPTKNVWQYDVSETHKIRLLDFVV